ncbi:hypothetical protein [Mycolicibacterium wolinskyi]|uniref:hypothetical protein n=1 Tax=Mycolicibacterium wolinskyi TaxID=59750 RepID=UPI000834C81E|nr:hypothetical protein [Mycolicibacterium wolinskyi]
MTTPRTDRLAYWLARNPKTRRIATVITLVHTLALWSVVNAPSAAASAGAAALGWTGLRDSYGVPIAAYFVSMVSTPEAALNNGQDISLLDPVSWVKWTGEVIQTGLTHSTAAWWLTSTVGIYVFMVGTSLWLLRFALSTQWLVVIASIARPVYNAVTTVSNQLYLGPTTVTLCAVIGGYHILRGRAGRGWALIGTGVLFTLLLLTVFADPIGELYSEHGLLALGRETGFAIAQATRGNPYAPGQSLDAQQNALIGELITSGVRHPVQVVNFGMVVDDIGGCADAYSRALMAANGSGPGPAWAMRGINEGGCGAPQAFAHAQQLGGGDFVPALLFCLAGLVLSIFLWYVSITNFLVGVKAAYFGTVVGPAFMVGMTGLADRAMAYAKHSAWQLLLHAVELAVYTAFLGIVMVWVGFALTTSALGNGTISVMPRMLIVTLAAMVALLLFRFIEKQFHTDGIGTIAHTIRSATGRLADGSRDRYNAARDGVDEARGLFGRTRRRFGRQRPDEQRSDSADDTAESSSAAPGFDTFKPRPNSRRLNKSWVSERLLPRTTTQGANAAAPAGGVGAAESAAAGTGMRAAAGNAAKVLAPEVAVPAAAVAATGHAVRKHREHIQDRKGSSSGPGPERPLSGAGPDRRDDAGHHPASRSPDRSDVGYDTFATRQTSVRPRYDDELSGARDVVASAHEAEPIERHRTVEPDADAPALELGTLRRPPNTDTPPKRKGDQK